MARITLIRHGKTEIPTPAKHDFDRSLNLRGQQNSSAVGAFLREHKMLPQLVLVSPAARTRETYELMKSEWPEGIAVKFIDELYEEKELKKKTNDFAKKFALKPSLPSQMIKRSVNALTYQNDHSVMHMDYDQFLLSREFSKENSN